MKAIISIITIGAAASLLSAPASRAQAPAPELGSRSEARETMQVAEDQAAKAQAAAQDAQAQAQKAQAELAKTQAQMDRAQKKMAQAGASFGGGGFGGYKPSTGPEAQDPFQGMLARVPERRAGRTLVVHSSEPDPKEQAKVEEDMAVMSHILEKAASERAGGRGAMAWSGTAMGIGVLFNPEASPLRSLYLEGYGALFLLNVGFPVLPPPQADDQQDKPETSSDWEEARQELYGQGGGGRVMTAPSEPYDKERVSRLRDGLLESLKNASNIHDLKPDDSITVCVFGSPNSGQPKHNKAYVKRGPRTGDPAHDAAVVGLGGSPSRQTIMTIRVKKSDADAFAKGAITLEAFRKRAHIVCYVGSPEAGMSYGSAESGVFMGGFGGGSGGGGGGMGGGMGGGATSGR